MAIDGHVVRRVGEDQLRLRAAQQLGERFWLARIPAEHPVPATLPEIARAADRWHALIHCWNMLDPIGFDIRQAGEQQIDLGRLEAR